ncbi:MAG: hypothetical protein AAFY60_10255, partial [Myxococcota bacterium]
TIGNYPRESKIGNALHNDIDIFRFSAVQSRSDCSDPKRFIRVFTNALNFANLPGEREIRAGFFANVGGGWITSVDSSLQTIQAPGSEWVKESEPPPRPPIRGVLPPGEPLAYDFYGSPALIPFDLTYQAVEVADGSPPPTGNVETSMIRQEIKFGFLSEIFGQATGAGDPFPGYPFPVSLVDSQGLWGFELNPEVRDPEVTQIVTITVRSQTAPLNPNALANIPLVYPQTTPVDRPPNAHPVHFPFDVRAFENGDGCAEQPVPLIEGNQQSPEVVSQLVDAQKPFVVQRSRFIGKGRDDVVCYEQEVRLVNPQNTTGRLNQYRLQAVLPGTTEGGNTRLLALTRCDRVRCDNCAGEGVQGCPADSQSPDDPEIVPPIECPDGSEFTQLEPTEPGTRLILDLQQAQSNNSIPGGGSAVLRYVVATRIPSGFDAPNFLTGRGGFGNRAIWTDETTPISLDLDFDDLSHGIETRFGFGGGGTGRERGDPGTGTSTRDPDDPDQTLATVSAVRAVSDGTVGVFEFETAAEILTGGFQVYFAAGSQWRETGPFLLTRPHRSAGVYRAELPFAPGDSVEVKIVEYELDGTTRLHGPYSLEVAEAPVAPELGTDGGWS